MLGFFKKQDKEIRGTIGYFGLTDWWLTTFTKEERNHIEDVFSPMGSNQKSRPLTEGEIESTSQTAPALLHALAGWFNNPEDRQIANKIIAKAEELASKKDSNVLDKHFTLAQKMEIHYREREDPEELKKAIKACKDQIAIAPEASKAFLKEFPHQSLPAHSGYRQLRVILEKQGKYDEALKLCRKAKNQGWADDWDMMIERLQKKKNKK